MFLQTYRPLILCLLRFIFPFFLQGNKTLPKTKDDTVIPNIMFFPLKNSNTVLGFKMSQISAWGHFGKDIL